MLTTQKASEKLKAAGLQYSSQAIAELARKGLFPGSEKSGNIWLIPELSLEQFIVQQKNVTSRSSSTPETEREKTFTKFLRDPLWQGVGAIAGIIAILPIIWGLITYFSAYRENLGITPTVKPIETPTIPLSITPSVAIVRTQVATSTTVGGIQSTIQITDSPVTKEPVLFSTYVPSPYVFHLTISDCLYEPSNRKQTGFSVKGKRGIVTALHGVVGCKKISAINVVAGDMGFFRDLNFTEVDIDRDAALLQLDLGKSSDGFEIADMDKIQYDNLQLVGYPLELEEQRLKVSTTGIRKLADLIPMESMSLLIDRKSPDLGIDVITIQGSVVPGHSGAPLLSHDDKLLGIVGGGVERLDLGWAIAWHDIEWHSIDEVQSELGNLEKLPIR